ncbi:MFS transporter [Tardiphaga sp. 285_C5_N1_2]|uniref:MFS transporter n=1 Tax=Tardiphaga sp. 285_C5_N1_2 TaxID=3240775 RepID=UPI003F88E2C2
MTHNETTASTTTAPANRTRAARTLALTGLNHALHDGFTDVIYVLLPIWQSQFALSYSVLAILRGLYSGTMACLQIPAGHLAERIDAKIILCCGTALAALGYALAGISGGIVGLSLALALAGAGSSTQHPLASAAVSRAYGRAARRPLGVYNFTGDLGKAAIPALMSLLLVSVAWQHAVFALAIAGIAVSVAMAVWMPAVGKGHAADTKERSSQTGQSRGGFYWLLAIGMLDSAVRMGFLAFLPFLLIAKGATLPTIGFALALVFSGGAAGKFACGWLGDKVGTRRTVLFTEVATALLIFGVLALPLVPAIVLLPVLGVMLNGTSSVLYGTVPELTPPHRTERAFALFYTGTIGAGAGAPVLYGFLGDAFGPATATAATAMTALAICPFMIALSRHLSDDVAIGLASHSSGQP